MFHLAAGNWRNLLDLVRWSVSAIGAVRTFQMVNSVDKDGNTVLMRIIHPLIYGADRVVSELIGLAGCDPFLQNKKGVDIYRSYESLSRETSWILAALGCPIIYYVDKPFLHKLSPAKILEYRRRVYFDISLTARLLFWSE